jgi:hypothetical protein
VDLAYQTYRACRIAAVLGLVGSVLIMLAFTRYATPALRASEYAGLAVNGGLLLWTAIHRRPPRVRAGNAIFLLSLLPAVAICWFVDEARAAEGLRWVPYEPTKLSALAMGLVAPPAWWVGGAAVLLFIGSGLVHHVVLSSAIRSLMASVEPWGLIAYGAFALVMVVFRYRRNALQVQLERERADRLAVEKVADVALALRDLANTPTQTIELIRHQLANHDARTAELAQHMHRALEQLLRLSDLLSRYAEAVSWNKRPASFDGATEASSLLNRQPRH